MATVLEIISNARENLKIDPNKHIWTDAQLTRWLNEGAAMMAAGMDWKDIEQAANITLIASTRLYAPATDYKRLMERGVTFTTSTGIKSWVEYREFYDLQGSISTLTTTGDVPKYVYETDGQLGFYPVPNATAATGTLTYNYYEWPSTYVEASTPDFPPQWHFLLEHYVEYRAWGVLPGREPAANLAMQKWDIGLRKMKEERLRREGPTLQWTNINKEIKTI